MVVDVINRFFSFLFFHMINNWQEEGWVVCRVFKKKIATSSMRRVSEHESPCWYDDQVSFMPDLESPKHNSTTNVVVSNNLANYQLLPYPNCKKEQLDPRHHHHLPYQLLPHDHFLPLLESPKVLLHSAAAAATSSGIVLNHNAMALQPSISFRSSQEEHDQQIQQSHDDHQNFHALVYGNNNSSSTTTTTNDHQQPGMDDHDHLTDWRVLDKFVASQLSHEDHNVISKENVIVRHWEKQEMVPENASTSTSASCQIELWK